MDIFLSEQLKKLRKEKGNTQEELAMHLGITTQAVSKWELGEAVPETENIVQLSRYYTFARNRILLRCQY